MLKTEFNKNATDNEEFLSEFQKLHYLQSAIKNEAKLLETLEDIFDLLFKALKNRFQNERIIANIHLYAVLDFERITHESSEQLRHLIDVINKNVRALKNLGFERNNICDILFTTIILAKIQ